jgi:hypothetical protein
LFTDFNLFLLGNIVGAIAFCSAEKPAEMATLEFPGRAGLFYITEFFFPAGSKAVFAAPLVDQEKKDLSFDMGGDCTPSLFITVDGFKRHTKELSQLLLCFSQFFSGNTEFFFNQGSASSHMLPKYFLKQLNSFFKITIQQVNTRKNLKTQFFLIHT